MDIILNYGSTEGKSVEDVASQLSEDLKKVYEVENPFEQPVTTVGVVIENSEVCMSAKDLGLDSKHNFGGETCDPEAGKRRKRRQTVTQVIAGGHRVTVPVATAAVSFTSEADDSVPMSAEALDNLAWRIETALSKLGSETTKHLSDEQLCDYAATSLSTSHTYISQAIANSGNFMQMKSIETKKPVATKNFYLHRWMDNLPDKIKDLPLSLLAIPGTHNSASFNLEWKEISDGNGWTGNKLFSWQSQANDIDFERRKVYRFYARNFHLEQSKWLSWRDVEEHDPSNELKYFEKWNTCLRSNTNEQLLLGIRYFDYR